MEQLSKQQLILLALLVSFVTSLATGIFTVSLMEQAPTGIIQTINRVVEKTVEKVVPQNSSTASVADSPAKKLTDTVALISKSIVKIGSRNSSKIGGIGLIVGKSGVILTDKKSTSDLTEYEIILQDNTRVPAVIVQTQINGDIVFLSTYIPVGQKISFYPIVMASSTEIGQAVYSLSLLPNSVLGQGIVSEINEDVISTSITSSKVSNSSPLFDSSGKVIGISLPSLSGKESSKNETSFYPFAKIQSVIPSY